MSSPHYYDDGNFKLPLQNGPTRFAFPFAEHGDTVTFTATQTMRCDSRYFLPSILMRTVRFNLGLGYLVGISETRDAGNGLLEWDDTFASLPKRRTEYGSISYTTQALFQNNGLNNDFSILEYTATKDARFVYEYSLNVPLTRVIAPMIVNLNQVIYVYGGWGTFQPGQQILAQDTTSDIYMGKIYVRKSIFIDYQPGIQLA